MTEATFQSIFPRLRERFIPRYGSRSVSDLRILRDPVFEMTLGDERFPVEVCINRALALALYFGNTNFIAESRLAVKKVVELAESEGYDMTQAPDWRAIQSFMNGGNNEEDTVMEEASHASKPVSQL